MAVTRACCNPNATVYMPNDTPFFPLSRPQPIRDHQSQWTGETEGNRQLHTRLKGYKPLRVHCDTSRRPFLPCFLPPLTSDFPRAEDLFSRVALDTADPRSPTSNLTNDSSSHARPSDLLSVRPPPEFGPFH